MSYILEALRKSQQERQAGQAPSLPNVVAGQPLRHPYRLAWVAAVAILVLNASVLGYFWRHGFGTARSGTETGAPVTHPHATRKPASGAAKPEHAAVSAQPAPREKASTSQQNAVQTPTPPSVAQPPAAPKTAVAENLPALKRGLPRRAPETVFESQGAAVTGTTADARQTAPVKPDEAARESRHTPLPQITSLPAEEQSGQIPATKDSPPFLDALPADIQQRLPPLKINLFAYAPAPAERFAIIDMKRYNVGDTIEGGPLLVEIRSDSLVLQLGGTKFRVRRP
jgi:general secretion pathway protein B